jgi:hypothetical protein
MKTLILVVLMLLSMGFAVAQSPSKQSGAPDLVVVESSWHKRRARANPAPDNSLHTIEAQDNSTREREKLIRANKERTAAAGREQIPLPVDAPTVFNTPQPNRPSEGAAYEYVYGVEVHYTGTKKILEIDWQYVFLEPGTLRETSRRQFTSKITIRPGQKKKLVGRSGLPPAVVSAEQSGKDLRDQYSERIEIDRIKYDDGSIWENNSK